MCVVSWRFSKHVAWQGVVITLTLFQIFDFSYAMLRVDLKALRSKGKKCCKLFVKLNLEDQ
jgi:hypothetical protein